MMKIAVIFDVFMIYMAPVYCAFVTHGPRAGVKHLQIHSTNGGEDELFDSWDPRLSPHMYPEGIPSTTTSGNGIGQPKPKDLEKIGVLLIDHGSRKPESNAFLHHLADSYRYSDSCPPHVLVGAAHMEISEPSIEVGIRNLISDGATRIVCVPYFLSPGRHATEDVPRLIEEAKFSIGNPDITITSTTYLGADTGAITQLISGMVQKAIRNGPKKASKMNDIGFFGEVMRMMDETIAQEEDNSFPGMQ